MGEFSTGEFSPGEFTVGDFDLGEFSAGEFSGHQILVNPLDFVVKHYINMHVRIVKYIFLRFTIFESIFIFSF